MRKLHFLIILVSILVIPIAYGFLSLEIISKPNIIVIMVDDLGVKTTEILLKNGLMPNLKEHIIEKGITFTNSFVTSSSCCPSRATFLTGLYSHNHGVLTNAPTSGISKFEDNSTLATWLLDSGYRTGFIGKYLNFYGQWTEPDYIPPGWNVWQALIDPTTYEIYNYTINDNGHLISYNTDVLAYQTDRLAQLAKEFIIDSDSMNDDIPFFLSVLTMAIHSEYSTPSCELNYRDFKTIRSPSRYNGMGKSVELPIDPSFNEEDVSDKPLYLKNIDQLDAKHIDCLNQIFQSRIEAALPLDDLIEILITTLQNTNELNNTIIIFTSDNGFLLGQHRLIAKFLPYEESIRVPLFIRIPGFEKQSINHLVINNDLAPTIIELTKAKSEIRMDGLSLLRLIENPNEENWRKMFLIEHYEGPAQKHFAVRTNNGIYIEYDNFFEYYDLHLDPYQLDSMHSCETDSCKDEINNHKLWLSELKNCSNGTCQMLEN